MRFQALMPDVLHWLGVKKIDNMVSMSDMYALMSLILGSPLRPNMYTLNAGNTMQLCSQVFGFSSATTFLVGRLCQHGPKESAKIEE
jgi:hypothetical protein